MKEKCINALLNAKSGINKNFPKYERLTESIFADITNFANEDFEGISVNKRYRRFLDICENILISAFEQDASKAYLRLLFKTFNDKDVSKYFSYIMQSRSNDFQYAAKRFVNIFVYWDISVRKEKKLKEILKLIDGWM